MDKLGYFVLATCLDPDGEGPRKLSQDCSEKLTVLKMDITDDKSIQKVKAFVEKNLERKGNLNYKCLFSKDFIEIKPI